MLCLSRKNGQKIQIGEATITILQTTAGKVRIGIEAPPHVPIVRDDARNQERNRAMGDWIEAAAEIRREIVEPMCPHDEDAAEAFDIDVAAIIARHHNLALRTERDLIETKIKEVRKEIEETSDECHLDSLLDGLTELEEHYFHLPEPQEGSDEGLDQEGY